MIGDRLLTRAARKRTYRAKRIWVGYEPGVSGSGSVPEPVPQAEVGNASGVSFFKLRAVGAYWRSTRFRRLRKGRSTR